VRSTHRARFLWIISSMWSHVAFDDMSPKHSNVVQMTFNDVVDVELAPKLGNAVTPLAPCTLRGRIQTNVEQLASWMCLEFRHVELRLAPISPAPIPALSIGMAPPIYGSPSAAKRGAAMPSTRPLTVQMPINFSGADSAPPKTSALSSNETNAIPKRTAP
jgi:hypothetical protein